ncbi:MAG: hypothetical protein KGH98_03010 [Candidatus Micrarchaeota archaeon]|nr:hypothetical protein [Candidatus Micrarchaeota archaeon]
MSTVSKPHILKHDEASALVRSLSSGSVKVEPYERRLGKYIRIHSGVKLRVTVEGIQEKSQFFGSRYGERESRPITPRMHERPVKEAASKAAKDSGVSLQIKGSTVASKKASTGWVLTVESKCPYPTEDELKMHTHFMERLSRELKTVLGAS